MNLTNWLCKHFDEEKKGYVTIGGIINKLFDVVFSEYNLMIFAIFILLPFLIGLTFISIYTQKERFEQLNRFDIISSFIMGYSVYLFIYIIYKILTFKVAKCPLKERENKE